MSNLNKILLVLTITGCCHKPEVPELYPVDFKPVKDGYFITQQHGQNLLINLNNLKDGYK